MNSHRSLAVLLGAALLSACGGKAVQDITGPLASARIRFFNFGVNAPGVNFYANDTKMTAISSTTGAESTTGVVYGAVGSAGFYAAIAPGTYSVMGLALKMAFTNLTLYAKNTTTGTEVAVGADVAYKGAGAFTPLPTAVYDLSTRVAGSATNVVVRTGVSFSAGRVYTIGARGDITVAGTTAANRPILDNTANR